MQQKYILAGGSGFLGQALGRRLRERGHEVVVLTRSRPRRRGDGIREVQWNPSSPPAQSNPRGYKPAEVPREGTGTCNPIGYFAEEAWWKELEGAAAVVNLAGRSINSPPTVENRRAILETRLESVRALGRAGAACAQPPAAWVQASAVGYYGDAGAVRCDEAAPAGTGALAEVCRQWEAEFAAACPTAVRPVVLRLGVVL